MSILAGPAHSHREQQRAFLETTPFRQFLDISFRRSGQFSIQFASHALLLRNEPQWLAWCTASLPERASSDDGTLAPLTIRAGSVRSGGSRAFDREVKKGSIVAHETGFLLRPTGIARQSLEAPAGPTNCWLSSIQTPRQSQRVEGSKRFLQRPSHRRQGSTQSIERPTASARAALSMRAEFETKGVPLLNYILT